MATVNLGSIRFNWKGAYNNSTAYVVNDVVTSSGNSYVCIQASQGNAVGNATAYWNIMSSAGTNGTNGTDVGTTITTQGDILYRDGSGLQRLAKPASNKYLQNTSGGVLSWESVSSDVVKLATASTTSTHSTIDVNGYFDDSVYGSYKLVMHSIKPENNGGEITAKWMTSSSATHDSANYLVLHTGYQSGSGSSGGQQNRKYWNVNAFNDWEGTWTPKATATTDYQYCSMEATIINPQSTSQGKVMLYKWGSFSTTAGVMIVSDGQMFTNSNTAMTGFRLYRSSNSFLQSAWELYGFKK